MPSFEIPLEALKNPEFYFKLQKLGHQNIFSQGEEYANTVSSCCQSVFRYFELLTQEAIEQNHVLAGMAGKDCYPKALLLTQLLKHHGIEAGFAAGNASWRVGPGWRDVVGSSDARKNPEEFHCWTIIRTPEPRYQVMIDLTTADIKTKLDQLDRVEGYTTHHAVTFPNLLVAPFMTTSMQVVAQGPPGAFGYELLIELTQKVLEDKKNDETVNLILEEGMQFCLEYENVDMSAPLYRRELVEQIDGYTIQKSPPKSSLNRDQRRKRERLERKARSNSRKAKCRV